MRIFWTIICELNRVNKMFNHILQTKWAEFCLWKIATSIYKCMGQIMLKFSLDK